MVGIGLLKRQNNNWDDDGDFNDNGNYDYNYGYSNTAIAIKYAFIGAILLFFLLWFVGGYYHAQRRIKKGLPPLRYHRFLLPRRQRMQYMPRPQYGYNPQQGGYGEGYPMQNYAPPPPAYQAEHMPPPNYQPPECGSKINPIQDWAAVPPPGPPPGHDLAGESSNVMQSVPLNQGSNEQEQTGDGLPPRTKKPGRMSRLNPFK